MGIEERIKELLGINNKEKISSLTSYEKGGRRYYKVITYNRLTKRAKRYHVPRTLEKEILFLWKEYQKEKEQVKELEQEIKALLEKYKDVEKIREILEKLGQDSLIKTASSYAIKTYLSKAKELFREYIEELQRLGREGVLERLTILQVLYLLANLKEISEAQENPKLFFKKGINTIIRVARNERIPNPFGTLKNDFFLSGRQTPYDFLLSNFLEEIIGETLRELLEKEIEKKKAKEEVREYKEKMEKLKEIAQWFESLPLEIKLLAKEIISGNVVEIAEKVLKDMKESGYELSKISAFLENSSRESLIEYFKYLKSL